MTPAEHKCMLSLVAYEREHEQRLTRAEETALNHEQRLTRLEARADEMSQEAPKSGLRGLLDRFGIDRLTIQLTLLLAALIAANLNRDSLVKAFLTALVRI